MQIRTIKVVEYRKAKVYIRNWGSTFEYLVVIGGNLYGSHAVIRKNPLRALLGQDYTDKQLGDAIQYFLKMAEATVDYVLDKPQPQRSP